MAADLHSSSEGQASNSAQLLYERGLERFRADDYDGAIRDLEKAAELGADTPDLYLILGHYYTEKWDRERAIANFDKFFTLAPFDQAVPERYADYAQVYLARAYALSQGFGLDAAIADCTTALELDVSLAAAYRERGRLYGLKQMWDAVIPDCTRAIELDPTDVRAHETRGWAYSELGEYRQAVNDFDRAIALDPDCIFPYLDRGYLSVKFTSDPEALDLLEVGVWKEEIIAPGSWLPKESWGQTVKHVQRVVNGEEWRGPLKTAQERGFAPDTDELKSFSSRCWQEILDRRRYQVPAAGRAEILVSENLRRLINLHSLLFVQEGIEPPGVFLKFHFSEGQSVGIVRIWRHGSVDGWHSRVRDSLFENIVNTVALAYYRDLVTPGTIYQYEPGTGTPHTGLNNRPRRLPRQQSVPVEPAASSGTGTRTSAHRKYHLRDWYYVQERARHYVTGHLRFVQPGYMAPKQKQLQAEECTGRQLPLGYTWVVEHERGGQSPGGLRLRQGQLADYTVFLPPERASRELSQILSY